MSINLNSTSYRPQSNWGVDLGVPVAAPAAPVGGNTPAPVAQPAAQTDWSNWSAKGQLFDHAYDAYMFSKFPLSIGGVGLWTGSGLMRGLAKMFSKIPDDRLITMQVRHQFMKVEGMKADHARVLQLAYYNAANTNPAVGQTHPLQWLAQYGQSGTMADWLVRGPLIVEMGLHAASVTMDLGFTPDVPNNSTLKALGQKAAQLMPPVQVAPPQY